MYHDELNQLNVTINDLNKWRDSFVLYYEEETAKTYFLVPEYFLKLNEYFQSDISKLQRLAVETTFRGWEGFESAGQVIFTLNCSI